MEKLNNGFDAAVIENYRAKIQEAGSNFIFQEGEKPTNEYAQFFFIGKFEGKEVIYDAAIYTLRLTYESELYEMAEEKLMKHYPHYKTTIDDSTDGKQEEEMGLLMAEFMMEIEEEEQLKVQEEIQIDEDFDFGVGLEASLNVDEVTPAVIERFVNEFNSNSIKLDPVLYSFEQDDEE